MIKHTQEQKGRNSKSAVKTKEILTALLINTRLLRRNIGKYPCQ
nr:hypothetical protein BV020_01752 [Haemophilus influenzae]PRJ87134.1 hypothetical protein BV154_01134 [Haemophilus influenzae]